MALSRPGSTEQSSGTNDIVEEKRTRGPKRVFCILNQFSGTYARLRKAARKSCIASDRDEIECYIETCFGDKTKWELILYKIDDKSKAALDTPEFIELIAREATASDLIIAGGGDGTVASCLSAMIHAFEIYGVKRTPIGILPLGTGNIIAQELGLPPNWRRCALLISQYFDDVAPLESRPIDALRIGERYRFLNVDIGAGSKMISLLKDAEKQKWGKMAYLKNTLKVLSDHKPQRYEISIDNCTPFEIAASELIIANAGAVGLRKDQRWGPNISMADGRADLVAVRATGWTSYVHVIWMLYSKKTAKLREKIKKFKFGFSRSVGDTNEDAVLGTQEVLATALSHAGPRNGESSPDSSLLQHTFKLPHFDFSSVYTKVRINNLDKCSGPMPVQADGDLIGYLPITVYVVKDAVDVLTPRWTRKMQLNGKITTF